jgi:hypothetical protein
MESTGIQSLRTSPKRIPASVGDTDKVDSRYLGPKAENPVKMKLVQTPKSVSDK